MKNQETVNSVQEAKIEKLLSTAEAAAIIGLRPQTLRVMRCNGSGPRFVRLGKKHARAMYRREDLQEWIEARIYRNTSEETQAAEGDR